MKWIIVAVLLLFCLPALAQSNKYFLPTPVTQSNGRPFNAATVLLKNAGTSTTAYTLTYLDNSGGAYYATTAIASGFYDIYVNGVQWRSYQYIDGSTQALGNIGKGVTALDDTTALKAATAAGDTAAVRYLKGFSAAATPRSLNGEGLFTEIDSAFAEDGRDYFDNATAGKQWKRIGSGASTALPTHSYATGRSVIDSLGIYKTLADAVGYVNPRWYGALTFNEAGANDSVNQDAIAKAITNANSWRMDVKLTKPVAGWAYKVKPDSNGAIFRLPTTGTAFYGNTKGTTGDIADIWVTDNAGVDSVWLFATQGAPSGSSTSNNASGIYDLGVFFDTTGVPFTHAGLFWAHDLNDNTVVSNVRTVGVVADSTNGAIKVSGSNSGVARFNDIYIFFDKPDATNMRKKVAMVVTNGGNINISGTFKADEASHVIYASNAMRGNIEQIIYERQNQTGPVSIITYDGTSSSMESAVLHVDNITVQSNGGASTLSMVTLRGGAATDVPYIMIDSYFLNLADYLVKDEITGTPYGNDIVRDSQSQGGYYAIGRFGGLHPAIFKSRLGFTFDDGTRQMNLYGIDTTDVSTQDTTYFWFVDPTTNNSFWIGFPSSQILGTKPTP